MAPYRTLLSDAPQPVLDAFRDYREGRITWSELRQRIDEIAKSDPPVKVFRDAKLAALDAPQVTNWPSSRSSPE